MGIENGEGNSNGVRRISRKIIDLTHRNNGNSTATKTVSVAQSSGHVLYMVEDLSDESTVYGALSLSESVHPDDAEAIELRAEEPLVDPHKVLTVHTRSKVQKLFTNMPVSLRLISGAELQSPELIALHAYAVAVAQYCEKLYRLGNGNNGPVSPNMCFEDRRHVNLVSGTNKLLSVQVRIKPFGEQIELAFRLMQRGPKRGTFLPLDNPPICFNFDRNCLDSRTMVSGDTSATWFTPALQKFVELMQVNSDIILNGKLRV